MYRPVVTLVASLLPALTTAAEIKKTDLFVSGSHGYHAFRIPSLLVTSKGSLLAICEGRKTSRRDDGDIDLVYRRSSDGGKTWSKLRILYEEGGNAKITIGNPCPVVDRSTGTIWLLFNRNNDRVMLTSNTDNGITWSKPRDITSTVKKPKWTWYATGPGVGLQLTKGRYKGRLVIPCDHREPGQGKQVTFSHCIYSDDHGKTWRCGESVAPWTNECQAVELANGTLVINMRNYHGRETSEKSKGGMRAVAISRDGGKSWGKLTFHPRLIEPVCQASFCRDTLAAKDRLLFSNPASRTLRHRLTLKVSTDQGKTWPIQQVIEEGPSAYSCLAVLPRSIACLYERGTKSPYERITLAIIDRE